LNEDSGICERRFPAKEKRFGMEGIVAVVLVAER
jgi:hypothetical protein